MVCLCQIEVCLRDALNLLVTVVCESGSDRFLIKVSRTASVTSKEGISVSIFRLAQPSCTDRARRTHRAYCLELGYTEYQWSRTDWAAPIKAAIQQVQVFMNDKLIKAMKPETTNDRQKGSAFASVSYMVGA